LALPHSGAADDRRVCSNRLCVLGTALYGVTAMTRIETTKVGPFIIYHMKKFRRDAYQYDVMLANEIVFVGETLEQSVKWAERQERLRRNVLIGMGASQ
jgi:hypothetical protein